MSKLSTGMILGGIVGISSFALLNLDKKDLRRVQRKGKSLLHKAEDLMNDIKEFV
ncbi:MAG: hypothetical protein H7X94_00225 [Vallitaleaceae bacterium]|nr:hypothetical protein [Vallitaleaceae bacterium]